MEEMSHETIHQPKTGFGERFTFRRSLSQPVLRSKEQKIADGMHHGLEIEICIGNEALTCLNDREFGLQWRSLYELCPWATVFQNPDFAMAWYEIYRERYIPVIVRGMTAENRLAGLLTLATTEDRRRLVAAGDIQAEYQCWLENPSGNNVFIRHALPKIREAFPGLGLSIKYLPANTPLDWIGDSHELGKVCFLKKHSRPLMKVDEKAILEKMKTKNNKKKFGKLKRFGEVQFECVTDHERLIRLFDEIPVQYDFRSHALHGISPFTSDPLKRPFHIELHRRGLLHTTILKAGGRIASTKSGLNGKGWVHDTLSTHSPVFGFGSPGTMHTFLLGLQLAREGVPIYDLTPGSA
jgi:CelD/BcsL family acetyltransferase involved in cellulose biosynthesis